MPQSSHTAASEEGEEVPRFEKLNLHPKEKKNRRTGASLSFNPPPTWSETNTYFGHNFYDTIYRFDSGAAVPTQWRAAEPQLSLDKRKRWDEASIEEEEGIEAEPEVVVRLTHAPESTSVTSSLCKREAIKFREALLRKFTSPKEGEEEGEKGEGGEGEVKIVKGRKGRVLKQKREKGKKGCKKDNKKKTPSSASSEEEEEEEKRKLKEKLDSNKVTVRVFYTDSCIKQQSAKSSTKKKSLHKYDGREWEARNKSHYNAVLMGILV